MTDELFVPHSDGLHGKAATSPPIRSHIDRNSGGNQGQTAATDGNQRDSTRSRVLPGQPGNSGEMPGERVEPGRVEPGRGIEPRTC